MINQPAERRIKKILVTIHYRGTIRWALVSARKVGNHYQISNEAFNALAGHVRPGTTFSMG